MNIAGRPFYVLAGLLIAAMHTAPSLVCGQAPPPQVVQLRTTDGVQLATTYYPSVLPAGNPAAKQVTPVIMLHDYKDTRAIFGPLATRLQSAGQEDPNQPPFAVVTVDLRGHGNSTQQVLPNGAQQNLDAAKIRKADVLAMAGYDMEEVRRFLVTKNDEGALNLNKLCIVGSGMGANVGANWAASDWAAPPLAVGKQGQDVKGLVLISPRWSYEGLSFQGPMKYRPLKQYAAWMLAYGAEDSKVAADIRRIEKQLTPFHAKSDGSGASRASSLVVLGLPTKLQGDKLLTQLAEKVEDQILRFLVQNVASKDQPWIDRRNRLP